MSADPAAQFDRVAENYVTSNVHATGDPLRWLLEALAPRPNWRVLDVGTGAGHAAMTIAPFAASVDAVDSAPQMLATAARVSRERNLLNIAFTLAPADALPWQDGIFDAAVTRYSAHHWPDLFPAARAIAAALRPGAPFVIVDTVSPAAPALDTFVNTLELLRDPSHCAVVCGEAVTTSRGCGWGDRISFGGEGLCHPRNRRECAATRLAHSALPR